MKIFTPKEQLSREGVTGPAFALPGVEHLSGASAAASQRKRFRFTHQKWTRGDGFTLSGARKP